MPIEKKISSTDSSQENELLVNRPLPITNDVDVVAYKQRMKPQIAIDALKSGHYVLINDYFSSGLIVLNELKKNIEETCSDASFQGQRNNRSLYQELSQRLLIHIYKHKITVRKAPSIGWLEILYPELTEYLLPFPQVQGLNSSWQWYVKGVSIPILKSKIHPFYGTYFPTRFEHLRLFENWLIQYKGEKKSAIDVGIGCGVLTYQLLNHGFNKVIGTDINSNAIKGITFNKKNITQTSKIELFKGDLFAQCESQTELIVFNPPWLPADYDTKGLDNAIYYDNSLFPRFFEEAVKHLKPNGRVILLFSNLAQITNSQTLHPIETEINLNNRFEKELLVQASVASASKNSRRNQHWRSSEKVEMWVLKVRNSN